MAVYDHTDAAVAINRPVNTANLRPLCIVCFHKGRGQTLVEYRKIAYNPEECGFCG